MYYFGQIRVYHLCVDMGFQSDRVLPRDSITPKELVTTNARKGTPG